MAQRTLPGIGLTGFWDLGFDGWKNEMDANLLALSALTQARVLGRVNVAGLPESPTNGMIYIVLDGANANKIALRDDGTWKYLTPAAGFQVYDVGTESFIKFNGTAWVDWLDGLDLPTMPDLAEEHISYANAAGAAEVVVVLPPGYLEFTLDLVGMSAAGGLFMRYSTDGVTYPTSGYAPFVADITVEPTTGTSKTVTGTVHEGQGSGGIYLHPFPTAAGGLSGNSTSRFKIRPGRLYLEKSSRPTFNLVRQMASATWPFSGSSTRWLKLFPSSGTFATGEIFLSGRKKIT